MGGPDAVFINLAALAGKAYCSYQNYGAEQGRGGRLTLRQSPPLSRSFIVLYKAPGVVCKQVYRVFARLDDVRFGIDYFESKLVRLVTRWFNASGE